MIRPHGGVLVNGVFKDSVSSEIKLLKNSEATFTVTKDQQQDIENIAMGVFSPLEGFLYEGDLMSVLENMRLKNGVPWTIPVVLDISEKTRKPLEGANKILLVDEKGKSIAFLSKPSFYSYDKKEFARKVFGTDDENHLGVADVFEMKEFLIGGKIELINKDESIFAKYNKTPKQIRKEFKEKQWKTVVAFQTRNVPHRGHEFLQKEALKKVDGLLVQPIIGKKKEGDFKDKFIVGSYELLMERLYPSGKGMLNVLPLRMRYAGPKEAVLHAIIRQNYGCTHFIVGRDHAGVGDFYDPMAAQDIFNSFSRDELGIEIIKFPEVIYNLKKQRHCFIDECSEKDAIKFSGTKLRDYIKKKRTPPSYLIREEIYEYLVNDGDVLISR